MDKSYSYLLYYLLGLATRLHSYDLAQLVLFLVKPGEEGM